MPSFAPRLQIGEETGRGVMRCYFHLENDTSRLLDEDGIEVADLQEARAQAVQAMLEVLGEESDTDWWTGWGFRVVDEMGDLLFLFPFVRAQAPRAAIRRQGDTFPLRLASRNAFH